MHREVFTTAGDETNVLKCSLTKWVFIKKGISVNMHNSKHSREGSRAPGARVKDLFAKLRGLWAPKYIPRRSRHGDVGRKLSIRKPDFEVQSDIEGI